MSGLAYELPTAKTASAAALKGLLTSPAARGLGVVGTGAAGAVASPHYVAPYLGVDDEPHARNVLQAADGATAASLAAALLFRKPQLAAGGQPLRNAAGKVQLAAPSFKAPFYTGLGSHTIPLWMKSKHKDMEAAETVATATRDQADAVRGASIPHAIQQAAGSDRGQRAIGGGKGALVGAGGAALAGMLSGALRRRNVGEERADTSRGKMIGGDIMRWAGPLMAAGTLGGMVMSGNKTPGGSPGTA